MKKKILFPALALLFSANAFALDNEPETGVTTAAFLGMNVTNVRNSLYDAKVGGTLGLKLDYVLPHAHGTYLSAGLDWTMKGAKLSVEAMGADRNAEATAKPSLHYLEIPIHVGFRYNLTENMGFYAEVGPYFAVGVGGKYKFSVDADGSEWSQIEDEFTYPIFKKQKTRESFQRWDAGLGFRVGAEFNQRYNVMLGCDWGLTDMLRDDYRDYVFDNGGIVLDKPKNFNFTIAVGYRF
ncbi:MAG: porin family protein [Bacteroidaceae bacterium]|nr:porin family protein [Bacteroidaceae bacterium]